MLTDSLIDGLLGMPRDQLQRDVADGLSRYFTYKTVNDGLEAMIGGNGSLERQNLEMEIALKRRALGLQDSQEFNAAVNTPGNRILASLGIQGGNALHSQAAAPKNLMHAAAPHHFPMGPGGPEGVAHDVFDLGRDGLSLFGQLVGRKPPGDAIRRALRLP